MGSMSKMWDFTLDLFLSIATKIAEYAKFPILDHLQYLCCFHNFASNLSNVKEQLELTQKSVNERIREATNRTEKVEPTVEKWLKDVEKVLNEVQLLEERILNNKSVSMIGLVGLGGSGKTTLAKKVGKKAEEMKLFEKVVMATIFDQLSFKLNEASVIGRAQRLSERLRKGTTLLILDDVWEKLNFEALGIPFDESCKTCCVLLTTRSREICNFMQCQSIIELDLLIDDEAWILFKKYAYITNVSSEALKEGVARKIINECKGLPIAIVTVASTLKGKTIEDFELSLSRLENSKPLDVPKGLIKDYEIDLEDLFRFGRGFCTVGTFGTMENARREMHEAIDILKSCLLLMQAGTKENVKMHDLVRDVGLWIAAKSGQAIFTRNEVGLEVLTNDEIMKDTKSLGLWNIRAYDSLNYKINCTTLEILLLCCSGGMNVPYVCSQSLEKLKTLIINALTKSYRFLLPESPKSLKNLRTLCLRNHDLGDISFVERLQALEILDLHGSSFEEFPVGIVELKKLKLLDLFECRLEKNIGDEVYEVVSKCLQLEELSLYLVNYKKDYSHDVSFSKLQRYAIINYHSSRYWDVPTLKKYAESRGLLIHDFDVIVQKNLSLPIKDLFIRAEFLYLRNLGGDFKNIIPSMDPQGMNHLITLQLEWCEKIECLIDNTMNTSNSNSVFSKLVYLSLERLCSLRQVWKGYLGKLLIEDCSKLSSISFSRKSKLCNLKVLSISHCPVLTSLFVPSIVQSLVLRHIIDDVEERNDVLSSTPSPSYLTLQKLKIIEIKECNNLEYIFSENLAVGLVSLESVEIRYCFKLKYVFGSGKEHLPNVIDVWPQYSRPQLCNLKRIGCCKCPKLLDSCISKMMTASNLPQETTSKENEIACFLTNIFNQLGSLLFPLQLERLWLSDVRLKGGSGELLPLNLDIISLYLVNLPELNFIWKGPTVSGCPKLKIIFCTTVVTSLPMFSRLNINNCDELEQIFDLGDARQLQTLYSSQQLCFPKLDSITVKNCNKLKCLLYNLSATHFTSLNQLAIEECSQLHKVFGFEHEADDGGEEETAKKGEQLLLQKLNFITLKNLPNFEEIHHGFKLKENVYRHIVEECPKYSP
ncbi:hypothetical protein PHAVU_008G244500, partial [Phaseolus vulgaris]